MKLSAGAGMSDIAPHLVPRRLSVYPTMTNGSLPGRTRVGETAMGGRARGTFFSLLLPALSVVRGLLL